MSFTELYEAILTNDLTLFKSLASDAEIINTIVAPNQNRQYLLHLVLLERRRSFLHYLLSIEGVNLNVLDSRGFTPLHYSIFVGSTEDCCALLKAGADVTIRTYDLRETAFEMSIIKNSAPKTELLFDFVFGYRKTKIQLRALMVCLRKNPLMYRRVMDCIDGILANNEDFDRLNRELFYIPSRLWKSFNFEMCIILRKMLVSTRSVLLSFSEYIVGPYAQRQEAILILKQLFRLRVIRNCLLKNIERDVVGGLGEMAKAFSFADMSLGGLHTIILSLVRMGVVPRMDDLGAIYSFFGNCNLFRDLAQMNVQCSLSPINHHIMPQFFVNVNVSMYGVFRQIRTFNQRSIVCFFNFFSNSLIKKHVLEKMRNNEVLIKRAVLVPKVPSLLELSRNAARKTIIDYNSITSVKELYAFMDKFDFGIIYKKIIMYETAIYP